MIQDDVNVQMAAADASERQVLAPVQGQIDDLKQEVIDAQVASRAVRAQWKIESAQVARLQSQLAMLNANVSDTDDLTWWRADSVDAEGRITQPA